MLTYYITSALLYAGSVYRVLLFASCVGYFDRTYNGFYVTSSRMLVLIEGDKIWQLWNSVNV